MDLRPTRASLPSTERDDMLVRRAGQMQVEKQLLARGEMRSESNNKIDVQSFSASLWPRDSKVERRPGRVRVSARNPWESQTNGAGPQGERGGTGPEGKLATTNCQQNR
jgi:ribosomal protein L36